jgi:hypothetical protein
LYVLANDSDPEGNLPLEIVSVSEGGKGTAFLVGTSYITYDAYSMTGTETLTYQVRDSLGAISTGTIFITVTDSGACFFP